MIQNRKLYLFIVEKEHQNKGDYKVWFVWQQFSEENFRYINMKIQTFRSIAFGVLQLSFIHQCQRPMRCINYQ